MDKLLGFTPDADPCLVGVITDCDNFIPYEQGMRSSPSGSTPSGVPALAGACNGAAVVTKLDDTRRIFAGTTTKLYELSSGVWTDVSSGVYTGGTDTRWSIAQFGNSTLASNLTDTIQRSSGAGFTAIATAPKAKIIFSVGTQIMALNINDGAVKPDGWYCCATFDETNWTTSVTTLCAKGQIVSSPGSFTAGGRLGEYAIGYKERSIHVGQFVGAPVVWDWVQVPGGDAGCIGQDAWCDIGGSHFIVGMDNIWIFDGSRPAPIATGQVRKWFYDNSNPAYRYKIQCIFDRQNNVVWTFYPSTASTTCDKALVYHVETKQWGKVSINIEAVMNYVSAGVTIDGLTSFSGTIDGLSAYSFDSQFWLTGGRALSVFNTSHQLQLLTGTSTTSSFTTGDVGDDEMVSFLSRIRIRFAPGFKPTSATVQTFTKMEEGASLSVGTSGTLTEGRFDLRQTARFHRATFSMVGDARVIGVGASIEKQGDR